MSAPCPCPPFSALLGYPVLQETQGWHQISACLSPRDPITQGCRQWNKDPLGAKVNSRCFLKVTVLLVAALSVFFFFSTTHYPLYLLSCSQAVNAYGDFLQIKKYIASIQIAQMWPLCAPIRERPSFLLVCRAPHQDTTSSEHTGTLAPVLSLRWSLQNLAYCLLQPCQGLHLSLPQNNASLQPFTRKEGLSGNCYPNMTRLLRQCLFVHV